LTELLFQIALEAKRRECTDIFERARDMLLRCAVRAGRQDSGWSILERGMCGLATLALSGNVDKLDDLKAGLQKALEEDEAPDQKLRDRAARELRRRSVSLFNQDRFTVAVIEQVMNRVDRESLGSLLREIANLLSPDTADEPIRPSTHYRWTVSRDSMLHERRSESDPDRVDAG
jgi:hypothetical protein